MSDIKKSDFENEKWSDFNNDDNFQLESSPSISQENTTPKNRHSNSPKQESLPVNSILSLFDQSPSLPSTQTIEKKIEKNISNEKINTSNTNDGLFSDFFETKTTPVTSQVTETKLNQSQIPPNSKTFEIPKISEKKKISENKKDAKEATGAFLSAIPVVFDEKQKNDFILNLFGSSDTNTEKNVPKNEINEVKEQDDEFFDENNWSGFNDDIKEDNNTKEENVSSIVVKEEPKVLVKEEVKKPPEKNNELIEENWSNFDEMFDNEKIGEKVQIIDDSEKKDEIEVDNKNEEWSGFDDDLESKSEKKDENVKMNVLEMVEVSNEDVGIEKKKKSLFGSVVSTLEVDDDVLFFSKVVEKETKLKEVPKPVPEVTENNNKQIKSKNKTLETVKEDQIIPGFTTVNTVDEKKKEKKISKKKKKIELFPLKISLKAKKKVKKKNRMVIGSEVKKDEDFFGKEEKNEMGESEKTSKKNVKEKKKSKVSIMDLFDQFDSSPKKEIENKKEKKKENWKEMIFEYTAVCSEKEKEIKEEIILKELEVKYPLFRFIFECLNTFEKGIEFFSLLEKEDNLTVVQRVYNSQKTKDFIFGLKEIDSILQKSFLRIEINLIDTLKHFKTSLKKYFDHYNVEFNTENLNVENCTKCELTGMWSKDIVFWDGKKLDSKVSNFWKNFVNKDNPPN